MTLNAWIESTGIRVKDFIPTDANTGQASGPATGAKTLYQGDVYGLCGKSRWDLYHLDDYIVSSVSGGTLWLIPKE